MTQSSQAASGKATKLNRVERNAWTKRRIFDAATKIVGKYGYAEASVARITEEAGVAQGTFYNHFSSRAALLDEPPPAFTSGGSFYSVSQPAFFALLALAFVLMVCLWVAMSRGN